MTSFGFEYPWALLLLLLIPVWWWRGRGRRVPSLVFSRAALLGRFAPRGARIIARLPGWLRATAVAAVIIAMASPRTGASVVDIDAEGIAIMLIVDVSSSMLAEDFEPANRLEVAKNTVANFVRARQYDRIGVVAFGGEALTMVPLTIDYGVIYQAVEQMRPAGTPGWLDDGTAIGTAVATATNRLRRAPGESKVIVLLTDGENNRGEIDPRTAAQIPVRGPGGRIQYASMPVSIDEPLLREVAAMTGGEYFRARDEDALEAIYRRIDELETTSVQVSRYVDYTPRYLPFLVLGMVALMGEWTLRASRWGRVP
jgi:Ca-activated chloride channel homolog